MIANPKLWLGLAGFSLLAGSVVFISCGKSSDDSDPAPSASSSEIPPQGAAALDAWLATGVYKKWACETTFHEARSPSPHGYNRICSNALASAQGTGEYPVNSAAVKELTDSSGKITGYAVSLHYKAGTTGTEWYWYEKTATSVVADGTGDAGVAKSLCVGCHAAAGSDDAHFGHDFIYTQVK